MKWYYVYIMSNKAHRLYIGITSKLRKRVFEHKNKLLPGFTSQYNLPWLVYYERYRNARSAIGREKQLKGWTRACKVALIEAENPHWLDLAAEWFENPNHAPWETE
ncbi:MAG TPA: GIY-YIG nuclease family protein [Terriglobales bacterium]|nr:GIY-YIG nuclease family protein [Terriglobales bacterium]